MARISEIRVIRGRLQRLTREVSMPGYHDENHLFKLVLGRFDVPAFIKRSQRTREVLEVLLAHCRRHYSECLRDVQIHLASLAEAAGNLNELAPLLNSPQQLDTLRALYEALAIEPAASPERARAARRLWRTLRELQGSIEKFNRRWQQFLERLDLRPVNEARTAYNRYYVLEKECAVRSFKVARQGFAPLPPLTLADLSAIFPYLPSLDLKD